MAIIAQTKKRGVFMGGTTKPEGGEEILRALGKFFAISITLTAIFMFICVSKGWVFLFS